MIFCEKKEKNLYLIVIYQCLVVDITEFLPVHG